MCTGGETNARINPANEAGILSGGKDSRSRRATRTQRDVARIGPNPKKFADAPWKLLLCSRYRLLPRGGCRMFSTELFSHRRNKDGTIVSICARCYLTVGTAWNESELPKIEHSHTCNPDWLFRWQLLSR